MPVPLIVAGAVGAGAVYKMVKEQGDQDDAPSWIGGMMKRQAGPNTSGLTGGYQDALSDQHDAFGNGEEDYLQVIGHHDQQSPQVCKALGVRVITARLYSGTCGGTSKANVVRC
jgi:hypothetical protein